MTWSWLTMLKYIKSKSLQNMGTCYVDVCVAFKAAVMTFPILGCLFQAYW
jgi:hypothetical protein